MDWGKILLAGVAVLVLSVLFRADLISFEYPVLYLLFLILFNQQDGK